MAAIYGSVQGSNGGASRTGTHASGMRLKVQTYMSGALVEMQTNDDMVFSIFDPDTGREHEVLRVNGKKFLDSRKDA